VRTCGPESELAQERITFRKQGRRERRTLTATEPLAFDQQAGQSRMPQARLPRRGQCRSANRSTRCRVVQQSQRLGERFRTRRVEPREAFDV